MACHESSIRTTQNDITKRPQDCHLLRRMPRIVQSKLRKEALMKLASAQIVLGVLVITSLVCPSPCPHVIFGAGVIGMGIAQLIKARK